MTYSELMKLFKNNEFRKIDKDKNANKFYLLRSISKSQTFKDFCNKNELENDLDKVFSYEHITEKVIKEYIKDTFKPKTKEEIEEIERELNKMQNFDWGGSAGNNLEKNIVNNVIKKTMHYNDVEIALAGPIQRSVYGYTLNSWYNHWSSILIEEIFNSNPKIIPTIDLVEKIDFFINDVPFDLKVTYFPEELMKNKLKNMLKEKFGSNSELTCVKKMCKELNIQIPEDLQNRSLLICLEKLLIESTNQKAQNFISALALLKKEIYDYYYSNPNELIIWLYENQGEMRFDAANRFYVVLIDNSFPFDSWKLKRNVSLLSDTINKKINSFDNKKMNKITFHWYKDGKDYCCYSEILFISKK